MSLGRAAIVAACAFWVRVSPRNIAVFGAIIAASFSLSNGTQDANANGETRSLTMLHAHTNEILSITYKRDGSFDTAALEKLNWFLRDWRIDEPISMAPQLFDVIWYVYREVGASEPIRIMSAYRSPGTNAMLRRRSRAVAKESQHMRGNAMDVHIPGVSMAKVREIGMRLQRGGVGYYPSAGSPFVHLDVGSVRSWPRMPRDQLERLFPDGKTVHIPADGIPLANYELALAEVQARGGSALDFATVTTNRGKSLWALLFGGDEDEDQNQPAARGRTTRVADARARASRSGEQVASISSSDSVNAWGAAALAPRTDRPVVVASVAPAPEPGGPSPAPAPVPAPQPTAVGKQEPLLQIALLPVPPIRPRGAQLERLLAASEPLPPIRPGNLATLTAGLRTPAAPIPAVGAAPESGVVPESVPAPIVASNLPLPPVRSAVTAVAVATAAPVPTPEFVSPSAVDLPVPPSRPVAVLALAEARTATEHAATGQAVLPGILSRPETQPRGSTLTQAYAAISAPLPPDRPQGAAARGVAAPMTAGASTPPVPNAATPLAAAMTIRPEAQTRPARVAAISQPPVEREVKSRVIALKFTAPQAGGGWAGNGSASGVFGGSFIRPMGASFTRAGE